MIRIIYGIYCKNKFEEFSYHFSYDKALVKEMTGFAGWNFIGASSAILREQGVNILINLFNGPAVNAARGISVQVNTAISSFATNFMTAINPRITKSYASNEHEYMRTLIYKGARFSFNLILLLSLPVLIKTNQIFVCGLQIMNFTISYLFLKIGIIPEVTLIIAIVISVACLIARLWMLQGMIGISINYYLRHIILNVFVVSILSAIIPVICYFVFSPTIVRFLLISLISALTTLVSIYFIGCNKTERQFILSKIEIVKNEIRRN